MEEKYEWRSKKKFPLRILYIPFTLVHHREGQEGYFEYGNFEFKNVNFEKQSGELKTKWGTKVGELKDY